MSLFFSQKSCNPQSVMPDYGMNPLHFTPLTVIRCWLGKLRLAKGNPRYLRRPWGLGQILTWNAQVDGGTYRALSGHLIHRLHVVTSCICYHCCQDDQLIVQSDCSAGHKWDEHATMDFKPLTIMSRKHPSSRFSSSHWELKLRLRQKREYLVQGSFQIQMGEKRNRRQSSDTKEDLKSLNKSLLLS